MVFAPIYFSLISKNWIYFELIGLIMSGVGAIMTLKMPESPLYLHGMKKYDEARKVFKLMANINGVTLS
jgi:hypothetical protein